MTLAFDVDLPHYAAWLRGQPGLSTNWPTWTTAGGAPFNAANMLTALRQWGAIRYGEPGVVEYGETYDITDNTADRRDLWNVPPAPSDASAAWLLSGVSAAVPVPVGLTEEYLPDDISPTSYRLTPSAVLQNGLANPNDIMRLFAGAKPRNPDARYTHGQLQLRPSFASWTGFPLIKDGGGSAATNRKQASLASRLVSVPTSLGAGDGLSDWSWDGTNWTGPAISTRVYSVHYGGLLHAQICDPETGKLESLVPIPECRRLSLFVGQGIGPSYSCLDLHWPNGVRALFGLANVDLYPCLVWRPLPPWKFLAVPYNSGLPSNGPFDLVPSRFDQNGFCRACILSDEQADIEATILGTPTGQWNILATGTASTTGNPQWRSMSLATLPSAGQPVIVTGGLVSTIYSNFFNWGVGMDLWPQAAAVPFYVPIWGGGAIS